MAPRRRIRIVVWLLLAAVVCACLWILCFGRPQWIADPKDSFAWEVARYKLEADE